MTLALTTAAALGLAVLIALRIPWHSPVFDYVYLSSKFDETANARMFKYVGTCAIVAFIAVVAILGPALIAKPSKLLAIGQEL